MPIRQPVCTPQSQVLIKLWYLRKYVDTSRKFISLASGRITALPSEVVSLNFEEKGTHFQKLRLTKYTFNREVEMIGASGENLKCMVKTKSMRAFQRNKTKPCHMGLKLQMSDSKCWNLHFFLIKSVQASKIGYRFAICASFLQRIQFKAIITMSHAWYWWEVTINAVFPTASISILKLHFLQ